MRFDPVLLKLARWSGLAYMLVFGTGWLILAHWFPPIDPTLSAYEVAKLFADHHLAYELTAVLIMVSTVVALPICALLVLIVYKVERGVGLLTLMMAFTLVCFLVLNFYAGLGFSLGAYRPDRSPAIVQYASDNAFLQFVGGIPMFFMVWLLTAYAILITDKKDDRIAPKWFGYFCLWIGLLYLPELLVFFFKTGPFAYNGIVGFWIPAILFIAYFAVSPFVLGPIIQKHFLNQEHIRASAGA